MILNPPVLTFLSVTAISVAMMLVASYHALISFKGRPSSQQPEGKLYLENKSYLVMTLISIGLYSRLALIPLWFFALNSLVGIIPGSMCLAGIHQSLPPYTWISTGFKFALPFFYGFWLLVNHVDLRDKHQPLFRLKHFLLIPCCLLFMFESFSDLYFVLSVRPVQVSCCRSLFDHPSNPFMQSMTYDGYLWVYLLVSFVIVYLLVSLRLMFWPFAKIGFTFIILSPAGLVLFFLAFHTSLAPQLMGQPGHHCLFCMWRDYPLSVSFSVSFFMSCWFGFSFSGLRFVVNWFSCPEALIRLMRHLVIAATVFMLAGVAFYVASFL